MKKVLFVFIIAVLLTPVAFAGGKQGEAQIVLKANMRNYTLDYDYPWNKGAEDFQKLHPNVQVVLEGLPYDEQREKILIAVSAGKGPDLAYLDCIWLGEYASNKIIIPVTARMNATPELKNDLFKSYIDGATWKGEIYGPWSHTDLRTLVWNKDMFRQNGLDPEKPPKTWTEMREYAKRLTDPSKDIWGFGYPALAAEGSLDMWYPFVFQGGGILSADNTEAVINQPHGVAALQLWYDLMHTDKAAPEDLIGVEEGVHTDGFDAGKYAMIVMAGSNVSNDAYAGMSLKEFEAKVGAAPYPVGPGGKVATGSGGWIIGITRDSKNPDMAWEFLKFTLRTESMVEFVVPEGAVPTYKSVMNHEKFKKASAHYKVISDLVNYTHFRPPIPEYLKIADHLVTAMQQVLTKVAGPQKALDDAVKASNAILADRKW
ncbi:MAG: ABC transporter substrate-binding protein [Spirochaetaceae bacterium]|nr:MAG: ABC transporter substrate-binding protein [Spirochaetaceae bacterium]